MSRRIKIVVIGSSLIFLQCIIAVSLFLYDPTQWIATIPPVQDAPVEMESQAIRAYSTIDDLVTHADLIVRGRVLSTTSYWTEDNTAILTDNIIEVSYLISGEATNTIVVQTEGGFTNEGVGMKSSNSPLYAEGQEILVFLHNAGSDPAAPQWEVISGELGSYQVSGQYALNTILRTTKSLESFYNDLEGALSELDKPYVVPTDWATIEADTPPVVLDGYDGQGFVYKNRKWGGECPEVQYTININTAQAGGENGSVDDFRNAIIAAANTWNAVPGADFVLTYAGETDATTTGFNGTNEIVFTSEGTSSPTGLARFWFTSDFIIVEADIWFNDDFTFDTTNDPDFDEVDLQSVALHEFGHWLALGHDDDSNAIMYPTLTMGGVKQELSQNEMDGIAFIYPRPADSVCTQAAVPTSTPTASPTPTAVPTATPLAQDPGGDAAQLTVNYVDGAPGSYFTIFGTGYLANGTSSLLLNGTEIHQIQADINGEFVVILSTAGAEPGTYLIHIPTTQATTNTASVFATQTVNLILDPTKPIRTKYVPSRSSGANSVEITMADEGIEIFLPLINR